jgi:hypothetical protein
MFISLPNHLEELVSDLFTAPNADESNISRRPSRMSAGAGSNIDETKSVKFASSSTPTTSSSRNKTNSTTLPGLTGGQPEEMNTISTIRTLLQYVIE